MAVTFLPQRQLSGPLGGVAAGTLAGAFGGLADRFMATGDALPLGPWTEVG